MAKNNSLSAAAASLRACYGQEGIVAGLHQFDDYWARDSLFASWGSLALGDKEIVRQNLILLLRFARDGQLPLRIERHYFNIFRFFNLKWKRPSLHPRYTEDKLGHVPADQNSLFIITCARYVRAAKDPAFLRQHYPAIRSVMDWNFSQDRDADLLMEEQAYAGWADSLKKQGKVLYTNVLHCRALADCAFLAARMQQGRDAAAYRRQHHAARRRLISLFWNGRYYWDFLGTGGERLGVDGNLLGVYLGIFPARHSSSIIREIERQRKGFLALAYPQYPASLSFFPFRLLGMHDYHHIIWPWLDCLYALALRRFSPRKSAYLLRQISGLIASSGTVHETYERNTSLPVRRLLYRSEFPFAWGAGMFVLALRR
ncbi:MAG TPA: GH116 family glycosyl hydrolase [Candidatus Nanoarchaeia archaeon]|nr:GH116 family glycosyl hydrolase [Candidatus Nanoarchaeia archaeon]